MKKNKKSTTQSESLFNTSAYSKQINHTYDPGWDTGAAFPNVSLKKNTEIHEVTNNTGIDASQSSLKKITGDDKVSNNTDIDASQSSLKNADSNDGRWNPDYFGEEPPRSVESDGQLSVFFDNSYEAPDPDDFRSTEEYETAWCKWEKEERARNKSTQFLREETQVLSTSEEFLRDESNVLPESQDFLREETEVLEEGENTFLRDNAKAPKRKRKGSLYPYLDPKTLKDGTKVHYPRVIGERDPDNVKHWRWGYCWEEKIDGDWKNRSIAVPIGAVSLVIGLQNNNCSVDEIISFIKRSKGKTKKST